MIISYCDMNIDSIIQDIILINDDSSNEFKKKKFHKIVKELVVFIKSEKKIDIISYSKLFDFFVSNRPLVISYLDLIMDIFDKKEFMKTYVKNLVLDDLVNKSSEYEHDTYENVMNILENRMLVFSEKYQDVQDIIVVNEYFEKALYGQYICIFDIITETLIKFARDERILCRNAIYQVEHKDMVDE